MTINNGFNILPWYDSLEKQSNKKWYAFGQSWPLACPQDTILPFQFVSSESISIKSTLTAVNLTTGVETDLGLTPTVIEGSQANANYYIVKQSEAIMKATLQVGRYYFKMSTDKGTLYSEEVVVVDNISDYIKLEYWNENTLNFMSGEINFADSFKFVVYIPSTIGKPEYEFEEELTKRLGYKFIESQTSNKLYKFNFLAPEYICDALRLVRMCDYIKLTTKFDTYNALSFSYEPKWQDAGYLAAIDVEFDTDCIIQKLESFNRRAKDSFYNALLAEIDEPVLFSPDTVAQYYTEFTSTTVVNGKLIRQLELINEVELRTDFDNIVLPIDNQADPSQKAKKITLTDLQKKIGDGKYLRKDKDDRSEGVIASDKGLEAGRFVSGILGGTGAWIGADGYGEMSGLTLREFLEVPELRFNRIDVVSGELWNAIAFGMVEEVDTENRICKIKLEENERCGLHVGDFCRGIFADFSGDNNWEDEDECRFMHLYGFWTSYFTPTKILDNEEGLFRFEYELKPGTTQHPTQSMKFAVYGHPTDKTRQASAYATRTYKRYLNNVDTWVIDPDRHIYAQYGDLNGLQINGVKMQGYGSFQSNAYFRGVQIQLPPEQMESLKGDSAYAAQLTSYVGTVKLDADGNMAGGMFEELNVIADGKNVICRDIEQPQTFRNVTTKNYRLTTTVQAYKGTTPLYYSADVAAKGSFTLTLACVGCTASVVNGAIILNSITDTKNCRINITVNCEGMAVYNLEYNVVFVQDGKNGQPGSPGQPGDSGKDAVSYRIEPNIQTISKTMTGTLEPESVKFMLQANKGGVIKYYPTVWSLKGRNLVNGEWTTLKSADGTTSFDVVFTADYKYYELSAKTYGDGDVMLGDTLNISIVADGKNGEDGASGAMPRYRGEFVPNNESEPYVYNKEYRDVVLYEGNVYQVYKYSLTESVTEPPSIAANADNDGKWQRANKFRFVAMDTALIDSANIGGFMFKRTKYIGSVPVGRLESQYGPVVIRDVDKSSGDVVPVSIHVESGNGTTVLTTQIRKTKGDYAYALKPTTRLVTLDKNDNPSVSSVSCSLIQKSVSGESSITSVPDVYTLQYSVLGNTGIYTPNTSITVPKANGSTIVFQLRDKQSGNIVLEEIVFVFKEESTQSTILYDRYIQLACNDDGSVKFGLPYRFRVSQWQGGKEVPLTNIDLSGSYVTIDNERIELDAETGTLKCTNVYLTGTINAVSGHIGDWNIENGELVVSGIGDFESLRDTSYTNRIDMSGLHVDYGNGGILADIGINYITFNAENHQYFSAINLRNMQGGSRRSDDMCGIYVSGSNPDIGILVEGCASSHLRSSIGTHIWGLTLNQRIVTSTGAMNPNDDVILFNNTSDIEFTFSGKASVGKVVFMKRGNNSTGSVKLKGAIRVCNSQTGTTSTERTLGTWSAMYVKTDVYWTEFYCG